MLCLRSLFFSEVVIDITTDDEGMSDNADPYNKVIRHIPLRLNTNVHFGHLSKTYIKHHWLLAWQNQRSHLAQNSKPYKKFFCQIRKKSANKKATQKGGVGVYKPLKKLQLFNTYFNYNCY